MSWVRPVLGAALVALGGAVSAPVLAAIVVASSGPSAAQYPPGKKLGDSERITLQKGDSVTVLDQRGTKVLRGPGRLAVSQPGRALPNANFAVFTRKSAASRARTGAVRDPNDPTKVTRPNIWLVDAASPGMMCVTSPATLRMWRPNAEKAERYRIASPGASGTVTFAAKVADAAWDTANAPVSEGASYTIAREGAASAGTFSFAVLADPPSDPEGLALALIDKGCTAQLALLTRTLATSTF